MAEPTTAPVTAEDLREQLRETARAAFASRKLPDGSYAIYSDRNPWRALDDAVDAVLAALAGDPEDLPDRMAAEMERHHIDEGQRPPSTLDADYCTCGELVKNWQQHLAAAAMSVRWEAHAVTVAERDEQKRRGDQYCTEAEHWAGRVADLEPKVEQLRAELADSERIRMKLGQAIAAFPDARDAANLAHARAQRDAIETAIKKLSARHQPRTVPGVRNCGQRSARGVCTDCETYEALVCSNLTCCGYPCEDRRAIDAALAVPESTEEGGSDDD